jgi:hypothetical protein
MAMSISLEFCTGPHFLLVWCGAVGIAIGPCQHAKGIVVVWPSCRNCGCVAFVLELWMCGLRARIVDVWPSCLICVVGH